MLKFTAYVVLFNTKTLQLKYREFRYYYMYDL
jgi:hypothetical protein